MTLLLRSRPQRPPAVREAEEVYRVRPCRACAGAGVPDRLEREADRCWWCDGDGTEWVRERSEGSERMAGLIA